MTPMPTAGPTIRVFCVDDNDLVADALRRRIQDEPAMTWEGWVGEVDAIVDRVRQIKPDVVLMDIDMPGADAFAIVEQLAEELPEVRSVMFSGHVQPGYIRRALDSGAWGYLSKNDDATAVIDGIRRVAQGRIALSREVEAVQRNSMN
jgi:two-component system response regulator DesR